jgi:hypothetical protein
MLNFPLPYPEELLYSTVARAGIRHGIASPKQLLDEVYGNRKIIATLDLPNHLLQLLRWLPSLYDLETIAYEHTLLPLYAPFIPEERRQRCLQWMAGESQGATHLAMGVAASIVKTPNRIRYCPGCLKEQKRSVGEYFWLREWQVAGVECCEQHGTLISTNISRPLTERHRYHAASPEVCPLFPQKPACKQSLLILQQVQQLLRQEVEASPSFEQWSRHYYSLAEQYGFIRGRHQVDHSAIYAKVLAHWSSGFLQRYGLMLHSGDEADTCWLRSIFRKHRKSFSYLQHLVVHGALLPKEWSINQVLDSVRQISIEQPAFQLNVEGVEKQSELTRDQQQWVNLLVLHSPKEARQLDSALYARLYRYDRFWLIRVNADQQSSNNRERTPRVDWQQRDQVYLEKLQSVIRFLQSNHSGPRRSKTFLLKRLGSSSTLEKKLHLLPETARFLAQVSESIEQYQIRRLINAYTELKNIHDYPPRWRVLRSSGLSEDRLTSPAREYLKRLEAGQDEVQRNQRQQHD